MKAPCETLDTSCQYDGSGQPPPVPRGPGFFRSHWRGQQPLRSAFGGVGFLGTWLAISITLPVGLVLARIPAAGMGPFMRWTILGLIWVPYLVFAWVSIWRCAASATPRLWGYLARGMVIVYALTVVSVILKVAQQAY